MKRQRYDGRREGLGRKVKQNKGARKCGAGVLLGETSPEGALGRSEGRRGPDPVTPASRGERGRQGEQQSHPYCKLEKKSGRDKKDQCLVFCPGALNETACDCAENTGLWLHRLGSPLLTALSTGKARSALCSRPPGSSGSTEPALR